jgi:hypothetical protein
VTVENMINCNGEQCDEGAAQSAAAQRRKLANKVWERKKNLKGDAELHKI